MKNQRLAMVKVTLVVAILLCATVGIGSVYFRSINPKVNLAEDVLTYTTFRGEFVSSVREAGDIESSSNFEVRCKVKSQGKAGTAILEIIDEGSEVKEGDFLCQLDDSVIQEQYTQQKIQVAQDKASVIQAESNLNTAKIKLREYDNVTAQIALATEGEEAGEESGSVVAVGLYEQELSRLNSAIAVAEEAYRRAGQVKAHSESLSRKGYVTETQLEADTFAMEKARLDLTLAKQELAVYEGFTKERMVQELIAEIKKEEANLEAAQYTLELSESRELQYKAQLDSCRVTAPTSGTLIYANETDRRGDSSFVIEEGALIRDGQPIFYLPDPTKMQVRTTVSDSKINDVKEGQETFIRVDTDPESPVLGKVRKVSKFPLPRRWYQAPIEYEVFVDIVEINELIRPGLRGKVEIFTERIDDVIQAPVSSLIRRSEEYFVLVKKNKDLEVRAVEIGSNNDKFVIIKNGIDAGEEVLVDPEPYQDEFEYPAS